MDRLFQVLVILMGGFIVTAASLWWTDRVMRRETRFFRERSEEQDKQLAVVSSEIQVARNEVSQFRAELTALRYAVEYLAEGPHSERPWPRQSS